MATYYEPSGKFSITSFVYFLLTALIAFPILGLTYAYCIWYIPFIYINFLIAAAFGFIAGLLLKKFVINIGKVRSITLAIVFGALGGFIALYFHWAVWVDLVLNAGESYGSSRIGITVSNIKIFQVFSLAIQPEVLFELIGEINQVGTWGIRGATTSGIFLSVIWVIELLIIVGVCVLVTFPKAGEPFCEISNAWFSENTLPAIGFIDDENTLKSNLEMSNSESFNDLPILENSPDSSDHSIFTIFTSPDSNKNFLSIENKKHKIDDKGKSDFDTNEVLIKMKSSD